MGAAHLHLDSVLLEMTDVQCCRPHVSNVCAALLAYLLLLQLPACPADGAMHVQEQPTQ